MTPSETAADPRVLVRRPEVLEAQLSERELVLLGPESEEYFGLDSVAADVWARLASPMSFDALVADLARDYDAPAEVIAADLAPVIGELVDGGLLERRGAGA